MSENNTPRSNMIHRVSKAKKMKGIDGWKKTKTILICSIILCISIFSNFLTMTTQASEFGSIHYVTSYSEFQDTLSICQNNDTIQINSTINLSSYLDINKSIIIKGKKEIPVHINGSEEFGINITTNNVTIKNLTIQNCSTAIKIKNRSNSLLNLSLYNVSILNCSNHGISIQNTTNINISHSFINNCTLSGIKTDNTSNLTTKYNSFSITNTALNLTNNSDNNRIFNNTFTNNTLSINITNSQNNTIFNNTFLNKTGNFYASDDSSTNRWNTTHGNYWSDYTGTDADGNGIGDNSYDNIEGGSASDERPLGFFVPIVNFSFSPSNPTTENIISFTDLSSNPNGGNLNYSWDFGDESNGFDQNPNYSYSDNGSYNVILTVTNEYGQRNTTNQTINVSNLPPNVSFNIYPSPGIVNKTIHFKINATDTDGNIGNWTWTLGDGVKKYVQNTTHQYNQTGSYSITLNATDDDGDFINISTSISVTNKPSVNFSFSPSSPSTSDTVNFTDLSTDDESISIYNWSFGDGSTSNSQHPTHSYSDDGSYTITLNVTDNDGASNETNQSITILNTHPTANFTFSPINPTDLQTITFTNHSTDPDGYIQNCTWNFGDNTVDYSKNTTSHKYADNGTYTVTLNVTDDDGVTHEISKNITVTNVGPTVDFTYEPDHPEVNETIWFNHTSNDQDGSIVNWTWNFDDNLQNYSQNTTHSYSNLNSYDVSLTVTDNDGNRTTITKHLILKDTTTTAIHDTESSFYNLKDEANTEINIKTQNATNLSVTIFSERPVYADETIPEHENLETYVDISIENESLLEWINFSMYYTQEDIDEDIDETSLSLFYWNETQQEWIEIQNSFQYSTTSNKYLGFVQANISHLTLFTLAGKTVEVDEDIDPPTLPEMINSSHNTTYTITTPTINVTYNQIVPTLSASLNGTDLSIATTNNKTFTIFIHTDLSDGNYTIQLTLTNSSMSRTDTINFSISIPKVAQNTNKPVHIPNWIWYSLLFFVTIATIWFLNEKIHIFHFIFKKKKPLLAEENTTQKRTSSQGIFKNTFLTLHQSITSLDTLVFGRDDPWLETKDSINHTLYNIDLFTEKPDRYVGIQQKLLTEEPTCKKIINFLEKNEKSIDSIKQKTKLSKDQLSKQLTVLLKYGLIKEQNQDSFKITTQAKQLLIKEKGKK